jgi:hypothetical protein
MFTIIGFPQVLKGEELVSPTPSTADRGIVRGKSTRMREGGGMPNIALKNPV